MIYNISFTNDFFKEAQTEINTTVIKTLEKSIKNKVTSKVTSKVTTMFSHFFKGHKKSFKVSGNNFKKKSNTNKITTLQKTWKSCQSSCYNVLKTIINKEVDSTAYFIRLLVNSIINITESNESLVLKISILPKNIILTGLWKRDSHFIKITGFETNSNRQLENFHNLATTTNTNTPLHGITLNRNLLDEPSNTNNTIPHVVNLHSRLYSETSTNTASKEIKSRLIMGFGPSASGKTYLTEEIIKLFIKVEPITFPKIFVTIDGGITREVSEVYQIIIKAIENFNKVQKPENKVSGFLNLVDNRLLASNTLFPKLKENLVKYMSTDNYRNNVSLYVPDTASSCTLNCKGIVTPYIHITGDSDSWIGLLIWQHKTSDVCDKKEMYKCKGTTESGTMREQKEGKIYSAAGYDNSMANGLFLLKNAPGYRLNIHNSGGLDMNLKSTINPLYNQRLHIPILRQKSSNNNMSNTYEYGSNTSNTSKYGFSNASNYGFSTTKNATSPNPTYSTTKLLHKSIVQDLTNYNNNSVLNKFKSLVEQNPNFAYCRNKPLTRKPLTRKQQPTNQNTVIPCDKYATSDTVVQLPLDSLDSLDSTLY